MIKNINDLSLFLKILKDFTSKNGIKKKQLYFLVNEPRGLIHWKIDADEVYELGIKLKLFQEKNKRVFVTNYGQDIIDMYDNEIDLNKDQLKYLSENCFFNNFMFADLFDFLKLFDYNDKNDLFVLDSKIYPIPQKLETSLLQQLGIVNVVNDQWLVKREYNQFLEQLKEEYENKLTQKQLDSILEEQKRIGDLAEDLTVKFEINRLRKNKLINESTRVKKISKSYVNKGYDVESFSSKSVNYRPNFFIEVKGRKYRLNSFIISSNEINLAKKLAKKYAIYFWNNMDSLKSPSQPTQIIIDPYKNLNLTECKNCLNYLVEL